MEFINNIFVNIAGLIRWVFDWLLGLLGLPLGLTDVLMVRSEEHTSELQSH